MSVALRRCRRRLGYGSDVDADETDGLDDCVHWAAGDPEVPSLMGTLIAQRRDDASDVIGVSTAILTRHVLMFACVCAVLKLATICQLGWYAMPD